MRIVGGSLKGRRLGAPSGLSTRPTSDRVREAVFNVLSHGIDGFAFDDARVLDLFAGSGALGLEAISRGAASAHFIETAPAARALIRQNAEKLGVLGRCRIWRRDATLLGPCAPMPPFDMVFADPPYAMGLGDKALAAAVEGGWLKDAATIVLEERAGVPIKAPGRLKLTARRDYGDSRISFFVFDDETF